MIELSDSGGTYRARIMVAGVGGAGNNAINRMAEDRVQGVGLLGINTDTGDLRSCKGRQLQIGENLTGGLGAGSNPVIGEKAAEESYEAIKDAVREEDLVIVTCGMGGGTGTGAAPFVAKAAKEQGILTIGIVTKPFKFEGKVRMQNALQGIGRMQKCVDTLIIIPNDKLLSILDKKTSFSDALKAADGVLRQTVQSISGLVDVTLDINLDFATLRTVIKDKGTAYIGIGTGSGENRALDAVKNALNCPLLETGIGGATDIILSISGDVALLDASDAAGYVNSLTGMDVNVIMGVKYIPEESDSCSVTVIATGIDICRKEKTGNGLKVSEKNRTGLDPCSSLPMPIWGDRIYQEEKTMSNVEKTGRITLYYRDIREPLFDYLEGRYGKARILEEKRTGPRTK